MNKTDDILEKLKNANQPEIDMTEEIMNSLPLTSPKGKSLTPRSLRVERELKRRRLWPWIGAVAASIIVAFFLWPNSPAVVEQPVVTEVVEQPAPEAPKASDYSESSDKPTPSKATNPKRTCEDNKPIKPQDEPLLAETETPAHDDIDIAAELADLKNEINELEYLYLSCNN